MIQTCVWKVCWEAGRRTIWSRYRKPGCSWQATHAASAGCSWRTWKGCTICCIIEFDLVLVLVSKGIRFVFGGIEICRVRAKMNLFWVWWLIVLVFVASKLTRFLDTGRKIALVLVWTSTLTWFLSGLSILTWFWYGGSNLTWFQFRDRNWFFMFMGVENYLV